MGRKFLVNPNKTQKTAPADGAVVGEEKTVGKNLNFLRYWMKCKGYTQKDLADRFGLNLRTINLWFHNDDVYLKNLDKYLEMVGAKANFEYIIPSQPYTMGVKTKTKRLSFLEKALIISQTGKTEFGKRLEEAKVCTRATMFKWFKDDNITISYIYKIAEIMGWEVEVLMGKPNIDWNDLSKEEQAIIKRNRYKDLYKIDPFLVVAEKLEEYDKEAEKERAAQIEEKFKNGEEIYYGDSICVSRDKEEIEEDDYNPAEKLTKVKQLRESAKRFEKMAAEYKELADKLEKA